MNQKLSFEELSLEGAFLIRPFASFDERGGLIKDYHKELFSKNKIDFDIKEVFYTISRKGVIRAIHFQLGKQQPKLIRCIKGCIYDVIVDLRPFSKTYGKWLSFELSEENMYELLVPAFFGHGYLVLEDSIVSYKAAESFYPEGDSGISYNDQTINIDWPFEKIGGEKNIIISDKDKHLMSFNEYTSFLNKD